MKINEVPKSRFVYPDKLYARCKDNKTLDMSYAPQNMEAVEYIRTDAFIEKVCEFLKSYRQEIYDGTGYIAGIVNDETIEDFKKYMEGE